ncbi:discoidin domain-containing protein [Niallia sp. Man26]|uniref:discoidin domain-containing protein n=1 Tax=Niallia sp. Man26 TaxID=2912824 RepID=UPI001EDBFBDA|nr:discoidin domain-containing protein [Niallia sp. Man26]UPO90128.1 discoidin domain-containing protein [Niallia sp. Man26]
MLTLRLRNSEGEILSERSHKTETYLAFKEYAYESGDYIELVVEKVPQFLWIQVDEALAPSLIYLTEKTWKYKVITEPTLKRAFSPKIFSGERHYITVKKATKQDINTYRNLALNPHDQKDDSGAYPHAYANVETRNDSTFFARNAIDGIIANENHGSFPYQSWGINQQADAEITIDFGRLVSINKVALVLRGDYPHDSFWEKVTVEFSNGQDFTINPTNSLERQFFSFEDVVSSSVKLKELIKHQDDSPFPALTQIEIYGKEINEF